MLLTTSTTSAPFLMKKSPLSKHTETVDHHVVMTEEDIETEEEVETEIAEMDQEEMIQEKGEAEMTMVEDHEDIHPVMSALNVTERVTGK